MMLMVSLMVGNLSLARDSSPPVRTLAHPDDSGLAGVKADPFFLPQVLGLPDLTPKPAVTICGLGPRSDPGGDAVPKVLDA